MEGTNLRRQRRPPSPPRSPPAPPPGADPALDGSLAEITHTLGTSVEGLSSTEAALRLRRIGRNVLKADTRGHPLGILANQFRSPLVLILLAAAALAYGLGETDEALIIALIVFASSGLGFYQEFRASGSVEALRRRLAIKTNVLRDGMLQEVAATEIVPGDVVILAGGSLVPADGVVLEAVDLHVNEAALTGESFPAVKCPMPPAGPPAHENLVHMGTSVRSGSARALVLQTGPATQFGMIASAIARLEPETSFAKGVRAFSLLMTQIMMVIVTLVFAVNLALGRPMLESLLFAAALAVGLTPELLPAIVTVTLARGARKLARAGVLVKRLVAIENLGAMDVLCTDKTGTLTEGDVRLERTCDAEGRPSADTLAWACLNARLQVGLPNPLDAALLKGAPPGLDAYTKRGEVPYDFERKRLSVLVTGPEGNVLICKGAVAALLPICDRFARGGETRPMTGRRRRTEERRLAAWSAEGFRVLGVAIRSMADQPTCALADETGLTLVGYLLFSDPPKPGIAQTIAALGQRGVKLKIITGDNRYAAAHVATQVGLATPQMMTGGELAGLSDGALARRAPHISLFSEVTPDQKERIVAALRRSHRVVGYLGDGINDAPALRAADLGISVDTAVDAAREAADIVLLRRDLNVLLDGILIGRIAFGNTLKYIAITTSANLGNMISMALASLALPFLPLLAKQILLNNFLSDLPLLTISTDRVDDEVVQAPGKWDFPRLLRAMLGFGILSSLFDGLTFGVLLYAFHADAALFQTGWFIESLLTELAIIGVMRTRKPFYASTPSLLLIVTSVGVALLALALPWLPLAGATGFRPLPPALLLTLVALVLCYAAASELLKGRIGVFARFQRHTPRQNRF